jgi:uncharacterized repeat protein (TIGR03803 family)
MNGTRTDRLFLLLAVFALWGGRTVCAQTYYGQTISVLYNFGVQPDDPLEPNGGVIAQGRDGNLYATARAGGAAAEGTAFAITPEGKLRIVYSFCSQPNCTDGYAPLSGLVLGPDGNFYGTAGAGGTVGGCSQAGGCGTVYRITPDGTFTILHAFQGGDDGEEPFAAPVLGRDGNYYGTTFIGGTSSCGIIYRVAPSGEYEVLHQFDRTHGCNPSSDLTLGTDGNFYGSTAAGGPGKFGLIFRFTPPSDFTVLHYFEENSNDAFQPAGPLYEGNDGNFYGTASGLYENGSIFRITPSGTLTYLYVLNGTSDGSEPVSGMVQATDGNFYGSASLRGLDGTCDPDGCGTLFKITPEGDFSLIFSPDGTTGEGPYTTLVQNTNGLLYGDMYKGGDVAACVGLHQLDICGLFYSPNLTFPPFVSPVPAFGKAGSTIGILGQGFSTTSEVSFNGTPGRVESGSGTFLSVTVPSGATTGIVTVTTPTGTLSSKPKFVVVP